MKLRLTSSTKISNVLIAFVALLLSEYSIGQNLIPNGGFENHRPQFQYIYRGDTLFSTTPINCWVGPTKRGFTYTHYNSAYNSPVNLNNSTPHSGNGWLMLEQTRYQYPIVGDSTGDSRHYAQTKLVKPLIAGQTYEIKLYVFVMYNSFNPPNNIQFSYLNNLGIHFANTKFTTDLNSWVFKLHLPYQVDLSNQAYTVDAWTEITAYYSANGGERYLTIGNFDFASQFNLFNGPPSLNTSTTITPLNIGIDDFTITPVGSTDLTTPTANLGSDTTICSDSINMILTAANGFDHYIWNTGDTTQSIQITQPGTYSVNVNTECDMCNDTIIVSLQSPKNLFIGNDTLICGDNPFQLTLSSNQTGLDQYSWSNGASTEQITINQPGQYILNADYVCGTISDTINVIYQSKPVAPNFGDTTLCLNTGDYQSSAAGTNLSWYTDPTALVTIPGAPNYSTTAIDTFFVWVTQTINTCESDRFKITTAVIDKPTFTLDDYMLLCEFNEEKIGPREYSWTYQWNDNILTSPRIFDESGVYTLFATNQCGEHSDWIEIEIEECPCTLFFPEAFTPDGDGINDVLQAVFFCDFEEYDMEIFNRWGEKVFSSSDPTEYWAPNEKEIQQAVYVLKYTFKGENRETITKVQKLVVLR